MKCNGKEHLDEIYNKGNEEAFLNFAYSYELVIESGGEGIIIRKPKSHYYDPKVFFKKERFLSSEVLVMEHNKDTLLCMLYVLSFIFTFNINISICY